MRPCGAKRHPTLGRRVQADRPDAHTLAPVSLPKTPPGPENRCQGADPFAACLERSNCYVRPETLIRWHMIMIGEHHLRRIRSSYAEYNNEIRTHLSLGNDAPTGRAIERFGRIVARPMVGGLHHRYMRI
jgi:hypothetical protein